MDYELLFWYTYRRDLICGPAHEDWHFLTIRGAVSPPPILTDVLVPEVLILIVWSYIATIVYIEIYYRYN